MSVEAAAPTDGERALAHAALHVVAACANQIAPAFSRFVKKPEELHAIGTFALYRAARRFRPEMNTSFEKYARYRVRGAMLDHLRTQARRASTELSLDSERPRARRAAVEGAAMSASDRFASEYALEGFDILDHDGGDIRKHLHDFASRLFAATFAAGVDEVLKQTDEEAAELREEYAHAIQSLRRALTKVPHDEVQVIVLVYSTGMTLDDASERLGIAYSTARDRHQRGLRRLHALLDAWGVKRAPPPMDIPGVEPVLAANDGGPR